MLNGMVFGWEAMMMFYLMDNGGNAINSIAWAPSHSLTARAAWLVPAHDDQCWDAGCVWFVHFFSSMIVAKEYGEYGSVK